MTSKSRLVGLVTMLMLFAMAPSLFAQVQLTLTPDTSTAEIQTNRNAQTATPGSAGAGLLITGSLIANSPLTTTRLRIAYPGPITSSTGFCADPNNFSDTSSGNGQTIDCSNGVQGTTTTAAAIPAGDPLRIEGATGVFAAVTTAGGGLRLNTWSSRVEVRLPATAPGDVNTNSGSFRIVGVRIDANGKTGAQTISASLNGGANNYLLATSTATVISGLSPGIASSAIGTAPGNSTIGGVTGNPPPGTATIFTNRNVPRSLGSFILTEGCASCWRTQSQSGNNGASLVSNGSNIRLTFNNIPAGVTLGLSFNKGTATSNSSLAVSISPTSVTSATNTATMTFTGTSTTSTEIAEIDYAVTVSTTAAVTTPGSITVTATHTPFGDGVNSVGVADTTTQTQGYPAFVEADVGPLTVVNIVAANTTLLMPYALVISPTFDTGIAIANTTADPFGQGAGATKASGTITLDFFPTTPTGGAGTPFSLTTSSTVKPGGGLSSDGTLAAGATWTVLLSQLLTAAGQTGNFTGYIFIRANFLNAHGTATISDFRTYSLSANVLVLSPPATSPRDAATVEALHF